MVVGELVTVAIRLTGGAPAQTEPITMRETLGFFGGAERDRTADLLVAKKLRDEFSTTSLYQTKHF
jgi:hypothetical protein